MTIFAKIIAGEIPCHRVYEDEHVFAFLDIAPLSPGHTLVIPKDAVATMGELSDDAAAALGRALPKICRAVCAATDTTQYNLIQNNGPDAMQTVPHVHVHIIPFVEGRGLDITWSPPEFDSNPAELAKRIAAGI